MQPIPFTVDEVIATIQFLKQSRGQHILANILGRWHIESGKHRHANSSVWIVNEANCYRCSMGRNHPLESSRQRCAWDWLMFAPAVFGMEGRAADSDHLVGALVTTVAVIAMAEVLRAARFLNILLGAWVIAAPWFLSGAPATARLNALVSGIILIVVSLRRGTIKERYATWDRMVF